VARYKSVKKTHFLEEDDVIHVGKTGSVRQAGSERTTEPNRGSVDHYVTLVFAKFVFVTILQRTKLLEVH
jgi:hypothetical protein